MLTFLVYLWLKLDSVLNGVLALTVLYLTGLAFYAGWYLTDTDSYTEHYRNETYRTAKEKLINFSKNLKMRLTICASVFLLVGAIPNSNQMAVLAATHYTQELVQSEEGQKIVQLIRKKATTYLDEQLKELDAAKVVDKVASQVQN